MSSLLLLGQKRGNCETGNVSSFTGVGYFRKNRKNFCKRQHRPLPWEHFDQAEKIPSGGGYGGVHPVIPALAGWGTEAGELGVLGHFSATQ